MDTTASSWEERFLELCRWKCQNGNASVPKGEGALGRWVARQRELKKKGSLQSERVLALESIGFQWEVILTSWNEKFRELARWKQQNGSTCVPISNKDLGSWVSKQRQGYKRGKLSKIKIERLNSLGFTWCMADAEWNEKYALLRRWKLEKGHAMVPFKQGRLGWWSNTQRQAKRKGRLSALRQQKLDEIGFVWDPLSEKEELKEISLGPSRFVTAAQSHPHDLEMTGSDRTFHASGDEIPNDYNERVNVVHNLGGSSAHVDGECACDGTALDTDAISPNLNHEEWLNEPRAPADKWMSRDSDGWTNSADATASRDSTDRMGDTVFDWRTAVLDQPWLDIAPIAFGE